jgi:hypothetical protein
VVSVQPTSAFMAATLKNGSRRKSWKNLSRLETKRWISRICLRRWFICNWQWI